MVAEEKNFPVTSLPFLPYFLTFRLFRVSFTSLKRRGGGISELRDPPSVKKSTTPDRRTNLITSAPSVNRIVCARTHVYSEPAKSPQKHCSPAVRSLCSPAVARFVVSTVGTVGTVLQFPSATLLFLIVFIPSPRSKQRKWNK